MFSKRQWKFTVEVHCQLLNIVRSVDVAPSIGDLLRVTNDQHIKPKHVSPRTRTTSPQKLPSPHTRTDIRIAANIPTVQHNRVCAIRKQRKKAPSVLSIYETPPLLRNQPSLDPVINLDDNDLSVGGHVCVRNLRSVPPPPPDGVAEAARMLFPLLDTTKLEYFRKVKKRIVDNERKPVVKSLTRMCEGEESNC